MKLSIQSIPRWWMDIENVVYAHNGILWSLQKELSYLCYNMNKLQGHCAKLNKPVKKGKSLNRFHLLYNKYQSSHIF